VLNTELLIRWNQSPEQHGGSWQFGQVRTTLPDLQDHLERLLQILPMFLILLPLVNMISAFSQFGIKPTKQIQREQLVKICIIYDREFDNLNRN
jgi:hypothetical protein